MTTGADISASFGWPCMKMEKAGFPTVYLFPVDAPGPPLHMNLVRVHPIKALGMGDDNPNVYVRRDDPLLFTVSMNHGY